MTLLDLINHYPHVYDFHIVTEFHRHIKMNRDELLTSRDPVICFYLTNDVEYHTFIIEQGDKFRLYPSLLVTLYDSTYYNEL